MEQHIESGTKMKLLDEKRDLIGWCNMLIKLSSPASADWG